MATPKKKQNWKRLDTQHSTAVAAKSAIGHAILYADAEDIPYLDCAQIIVDKVVSRLAVDIALSQDADVEEVPESE